jgi:lysyl-tRNA synthetase class 2
LDRASWLKEVGYPGERFAVSHTLPQYADDFAGLASGAREIGVKTAVTGRVTSVRESSNALCFYDLSADGASVQVLSTRKHFNGSDDEYAQTRSIKRGDVVGEC